MYPSSATSSPTGNSQPSAVSAFSATYPARRCGREHLVAGAQEVIQPDRAVGAGDLVAQVHAAAERPAHFELPDRAGCEAHERDRVVLGLDGVHQRVGPAHHLHGPVSLADEVADDLDAVAAEIDDRAAAGEPMVPEPRSVRPRMRFARPHPGHLTDRALAHRRNRLQRLRRVAQVLEVTGEDARVLDHLQHPPCLVGGAPERLGAQDRLARPRGHGDGLLVQVIGKRDHDDVGLRMSDGRGHVRERMRHAPALRKGLGARRLSRVDHVDPIATALRMQRARIEIADQPGAEHRDGVTGHSENSVMPNAGCGMPRCEQPPFRRPKVAGYTSAAGHRSPVTVRRPSSFSLPPSSSLRPTSVLVPPSSVLSAMSHPSRVRQARLMLEGQPRR